MQMTCWNCGRKVRISGLAGVLILAGLMLPMGGCKSKTEEERLAEAGKALEERNIIGAELMLKEFLEKFPDSDKAIAARFGLSQAYFMDRSYDKCREELDRIIGIVGGVDNRLGLNAAMLKLDSYLMEERLDVALNEAVKTSGSLKTVEPPFRQFLNIKTAQLFIRNNKSEEALIMCKALVREQASPEIQFDALKIMDDIYREGKRAEEFIQENKAFLERFPQSSLTLVIVVKLAQALDQEGRKEEAAAYYDQAEGLMRKDIAAAVGAEEKIKRNISLAQFFEMQNKPTKAQEVLGQIIADYPMDGQRPIIMRMLAESFFKAGNRTEGKRMLDEIIAAYPNTPHAVEAARGKQEVAAAEAKENNGATTGTETVAPPPVPAPDAPPAAQDPAPAPAQ